MPRLPVRRRKLPPPTPHLTDLGVHVADLHRKYRATLGAGPTLHAYSAADDPADCAGGAGAAHATLARVFGDLPPSGAPFTRPRSALCRHAGRPALPARRPRGTVRTWKDLGVHVADLHRRFQAGSCRQSG